MSSFDFDEGYDFDDPKHPDYGDLWASHADFLRKREKEEQAREDDGA